MARKDDHIRHATTDGVFAKVANDIAITKWYIYKSGANDCRLSGEHWNKVLINLIVGLTGLTEKEVEKRLAAEIKKQEKDIERMEAAMYKMHKSFEPEKYSPDHRDALVKGVDIIGDR